MRDPETIGRVATMPDSNIYIWYKKSPFNNTIQITQALVPGIFWLNLPVAIILF